MTAEVEAALAGAPPDAAAPVQTSDGAGGELVQEQPSESWRKFCAGLVPGVCILAVPQWNITEAEQAELAESLGLCLDELFPGGMDGKYSCWARLLVCAGGITLTRYAEHGKLPPFGRPETKKEKADTSAAPVGPAQNGSGFSTSA